MFCCDTIKPYLLQERNLKFWKRCHLNKKSCRIQRSFDRNLTVFLHFLSILWKRYHLGFIRIIRIKNKADKSASNSLNLSIFEGLVTLCAPDAVCFSRHVPHASGRILAERFYVIGTLRSNFLLHKKSRINSWILVEVPPGFEPGIEVLQTFALPLGYGTKFNCFLKGSDSKGIWTPVTAVKGRCLNRLTMEPFS